jgi:DNA polymerase III subunit alpha
VQNYLKRKYGEDKVAQIGTKGTLAAKAAIRLVGKTLGYDAHIVDEFAKAIPNTPGIKLIEAYNQEERVKAYADHYKDWWEAALKLEGHVRSYGVHAGGIVISPVPLTKVVPLRLDSEGLVTTQYDMSWIEKLLVKFDILKLDTLDLIKKTLEYAGLWGKFDIEDIDLNDPYVYEKVYNQLNLSGIFQCESDLYKSIIAEMKPNCFEDISVIMALGRPGPLDLIPSYIRRKWGFEKVTYPFSELEPVLKKTYGVWVYQEQIMEASRIIGNLTMGQADLLRKGIGKKKHDLMNRWIDLMIYGSEIYKQRHAELTKQYPNQEDIPLNEEGKPIIWVDYEYEDVPFVEGGINRGFDEQKLLELKKQWIKFGDYAFNKSHSASYAKVSVITAWLKAYYPVEFMAALLTIAEGKKDKNGDNKTVRYMKECEQMGIRILPPDINKSKDSWTPIRYDEPKDGYIGEIRFGLSSIAGFSSKTVENILLGQPYDSVQELIEKTDPSKVDRTKIINLIKAGTFDSIDPNRNKLLREFLRHRDEDYSNIPERTNKSHIIQYERELLGMSISVRSRWETIEDGKENIQFTGHLLRIDPFIAKKTGIEHCRITLQTAEDEIQCMVFNREWMQFKPYAIVGMKVTFKGKKSDDKLLVNYIQIHSE